MSEFKHVNYALGFKVDAKSFPKTYGIVNRKPRPYVRNYKRPVPNGMDWLEAIRWTYRQRCKAISGIAAIHFGRTA